MKLVRPGKEFTLTARVRDPFGRLKDPEHQEITLVNPEAVKVLTISTPEKLDVGIYRIKLTLPKDAVEGIWRIVWYIMLDGKDGTSVTEVQVSHLVHHQALQTEVQARDFYITFLGTRGDIEESSFKHQNTSALVLHHGDHKILVDFGEGNLELPEGITEIIITHAHPDHAFGLRGHQIDVPVYLNKFSNRLLAKEDFPFRRKIFWRKPFMIGDIKVTPVPVLHSIKAPASGLIFQASGRKIAYFSDVLQVRNLEALRHCDLYIGDGAALERNIAYRKGNKKVGHASIRTQLRWLQRAGVKRAIFTHYGKWAISGRQVVCRALQSLEKEFGIEVWEAYDGYKCQIGRQIILERGKPGIYLVPPHARLIAEGLKTLIVSTQPIPRAYVGKNLYFIQDKKCYGILRIPKTVQPQDAKTVLTKFSSEHQISPREWQKWWPEAKQVYAYALIVEKLYLPPKDYSPPLGVKKWIRHVELQQSIVEIQAVAEMESPYAPVHPSGEEGEQQIKLSDVLSRWNKPIVLKSGYITLMGGLANRGESTNDIDILIAEAKEITERDQPTIFRIGRALDDLAKFVKLKYTGEYGGVFTSHVPVYDLVLVPSTERKLIRMGRVETIKDSLARSQASASLRENAVKPVRFVVPLKGYKGYYKMPELAEAATYFKEDDYPIYGQKKYDGVIVEWMKDGDTVIGRTDDGKDVTKRFPTLVKIIKETWPRTITALSETEMWVEGKHQPREVTSGYMMSRSPADDSKIVSNIFDVMYFNDPKYEHHELKGTVGDLHDKPYELRYRYLKQITWQQSTNDVPKKIPGFNLTPSIIIRNPKELTKALETLADYEASEGAVLKSSKGEYELDGITRKQVKWKKMAELHAAVVEKIETRTPNVFNLRLGLRIPAGWKVPKNKIMNGYMYIGKTFNVAEKVKVGDIISMTFHTLNHYKRAATDEQYVTVYEPKFIDVRPQQKLPDSAAEAVEVAKKKELLTIKRLQKLPMDDKPHKAVLQNHYRDPHYDELIAQLSAALPGSPQFELLMDELIRLENMRFLGRSAHMDFRILVRDEKGRELEGFTIYHLIPDTIKEPVVTIAQAKAIEKNWDKYFKLRDIPQTDIPGRRKIRVGLKKPEPKDWLNVEKVMPKGEVGATREEFGVFSIVDRPTVYFGAQKPYFKEFFIQGKIMSGRWVVNYLPNPWKAQEPRTEFVYLMWKPEDQTPYVLTSRAVKKKWVPPFGVSCLPPSTRNIISEKYKYWDKRNNSERLATRDELVTAIRKGEVKLRDVRMQDPPDIKQSRSVRAVLQHFWYRGQYVVRGGPSKEFWYLRLEYSPTEPLATFILRENPLTEDSTSGKFEATRDHKWMKVTGVKDLPPGTAMNPTPATPAFIQTIDSGTAMILDSGNLFMKVRFGMKKLKGLWIFTKRDPRQNLWVVSKEEAAP